MEIITGLSYLIFGITGILLSPLFVYTTLWWLPIILIGGILTGEIFRSKSWAMLSPFIVLEMTFKNNTTTARILGFIYSIFALAGSYMLYKKDFSYNGTTIFGVGDGSWNIILTYYCAFLGITMLIGVFMSFFNKSNK